MQSMSVFVWAALAIFVFYTTGKKDRPLAIAMSGFFVFMAVWYGLRSFAGDIYCAFYFHSPRRMRIMMKSLYSSPYRYPCS